ncbi:MAG: PilZ domain-containing protein [Acidobacteria bacterium]|nr:PilZ domain-containing protein [Acidobacteriota bacterium]
MTNERRDEERISLNLEARWEGIAHSARVSDISVDGCYVDTIATAVSVGELILIEIKLPNGKWLPLRGEVTHTMPNVGFGLCFTFLTEDEQRLIAQLNAM